MGEPAPKLPSEDIPDIPGLRALEGGGEGDGKPAGKLSAVGDDAVGKGFSGSEIPGLGGRMKEALSLHKNRRVLVGGGLFGGAVALLIAMFLALIPLKINSILSNIEQKFFASSNQAVEDETGKLFSNYVKRHIIPNMNKSSCNNTRGFSSSCIAPISGTSPIARLYDGWRQGRLETKLATDYNIEFGRKGNQIFMRAPGLSPNGVDITHLGDHGQPATIFDYPAVSRSQARTAMRDALSNETQVKKVFMRFKVGALLESKYGIKRCIIACKTRDAFSDKVESKKRAAKAKLIERVIEPRSANLASAINCLLLEPCSTGTPTPGDPNSPTNGAPTNEIDNQISSNLAQAAASFGSRSLDTLASILDDIRTNHNGSFQDYLVKKVLEKLGFGAATTELAEKGIPVVGWISMASKIIAISKNAGPELKKFTYVINTASMASLYMTYRTVADETKSGHIDPTELGSFVNELGPNTKANGSGTAADSTPLYQEVVNHGALTTTTSFGIFPSAFAAGTSTTNTGYTCDNGQPVPAGKKICPEEDPRVSNSLTKILSAISQYIPGPLATLASYFGRITSAVGGVVSGIGGLVCDVPLIHSGCEAAKNAISAAINAIAGPVFSWAVNTLFPPNVGTDMSGGRTVDMIIGGGDVIGNNSAHNLIGGRMVSPAEMSYIQNQQVLQDRASFDRQPLFARMFSTDSQYSFASQVALRLPNNVTQVSNSVASLLNPMYSLAHGFASFFSSPRVFAGSTPEEDPFGIAQYGYLPSDIPSDPEAYWNKNCTTDDQTKHWNSLAAADVNQETGETTNRTTNPCLLIKAAADSAGAMFQN